MGVLPIVLLILAMKIPIFGLLWFVFWAARMPETDGPAEEKVRRSGRPRRPEPPRRRRPRRPGPAGGAAVAAPLSGGHAGRVHAPAVARRVPPPVRH